MRTRLSPLDLSLITISSFFDGEILKKDSNIERSVAERSMLLKHILVDVPDALNEPIPLDKVCLHRWPQLRDPHRRMQVNEAVLHKVIEWCNHHRSDPPASADDDSDSRRKTTDIDEWDQKFLQVDQEMLFEIILVGHESLTRTFE